MADKVSIKKEEAAGKLVGKPMDIPKRQTEEVYSVSDFSKAAKALFGVQPECVIAAFFSAGKDFATESEARKTVIDFMEREVK